MSNTPFSAPTLTPLIRARIIAALSVDIVNSVNFALRYATGESRTFWLKFAKDSGTALNWFRNATRDP